MLAQGLEELTRGGWISRRGGGCFAMFGVVGLVGTMAGFEVFDYV